MRLRNVSPRGDLRVTGHGHVPFGAEFDVLKEHVEGLIHQAYGEDKNFEPADAEAAAAVAAGEQSALQAYADAHDGAAAAWGSLASAAGVVVTVDPATGATTETPGDTITGDGTGTALPAANDDGPDHLDTTPDEENQ